MSQKDNQKFTDQLRDDSGHVKSKDPLVGFLYTLMRDHLPTGTVEQLVQETQYGKNKECLYTNGWLAEYAENLAQRISQVPTDQKYIVCPSCNDTKLDDGGRCYDCNDYALDRD